MPRLCVTTVPLLFATLCCAAQAGPITQLHSTRAAISAFRKRHARHISRESREHERFNTSQGECQFYGAYEGSEDATLWRDGVAFVSSGLFESETQGGLILAADLAGNQPVLHNMELRNLPEDYARLGGFRPHGMYLDNATQRLFAISHSDLLEEESIAVFHIRPSPDSRIPALEFAFSIISPNFPWWPEEFIWFLNDLGVISSTELFVSQFGPVGVLDIPKHMWKCVWDEADVRPDGRLPAQCEIAHPDVSIGLNGMNINADKTIVWANDLFLSKLWTFEHLGDRVLRRLPDLELPGVETIIDNVEYDFASGDLAMGWIQTTLPLSVGGAIFARRAEEYRPELSLEQDTGMEYAVSTSLEYGRWVLLGSPGDTGLVICERSSGQ